MIIFKCEHKDLYEHLLSENYLITYTTDIIEVTKDFRRFLLATGYGRESIQQAFQECVNED